MIATVTIIDNIPHARYSDGKTVPIAKISLMEAMAYFDIKHPEKFGFKEGQQIEGKLHNNQQQGECFVVDKKWLHPHINEVWAIWEQDSMPIAQLVDIYKDKEKAKKAMKELQAQSKGDCEYSIEEIELK